MHYEILVEDQSGQSALEVLVPKMLIDSNASPSFNHFVQKLKELAE